MSFFVYTSLFTASKDLKEMEGKVAFLTFHESKGLERKFVIVLAFDISLYLCFQSLKKDSLLNELYVALSRSTENLVVMRSKKYKLFSFINLSVFPKYVEYDGLKEEPRANSISGNETKKTIEKNISIEYLFDHLPYKVHIKVNKILKVSNTPLEKGKHRPLNETINFDGIIESVSEITIIALLAYFQLKIQKKITFVDQLRILILSVDGLNMLKNRKIIAPVVCYYNTTLQMADSNLIIPFWMKYILLALDKLEKENYENAFEIIVNRSAKNRINMTAYLNLILSSDKGISTDDPRLLEVILNLSLIFFGAKSQYMYKSNQVQIYDWIDFNTMYDIYESLFQRIGSTDGLFFFSSFKVKYEGFCIEVSVDIIDNNKQMLWFVKDSARIDKKLYLKVAISLFLWRLFSKKQDSSAFIFNINTDEVIKIENTEEELKKMIDVLIKSKKFDKNYFGNKKMFVAKCALIRENVLNNIPQAEADEEEANECAPNEVFQPSKEQLKIVEASQKENVNIKINCAAGSGKTTTALLVAKANPKIKYLLLTYNARLKADTRKRIKKDLILNMECHTYHSFYYLYFDTNCHKDPGLEKLLDLGQKRMKAFFYNCIIIDEIQDCAMLTMMRC